MENVHTALNALLQAEGTALEARMQSRLFDACMTAGMAYDEPCVTTWALNACTADLLSA